MSGFLCAIAVLASLTAAELVSVDVVKGDTVSPGLLLAGQDRADAEMALAEATAARDQASAELANLREGGRDEEIAVTEASLASAGGRLREAESTAERQSRLADDGVISQALLDRDIAARDMAAADVTELEARLAVARLPARPQIVAAAEVARDQAAWRHDRRTLTAPAAGTVSEVFHPLRPHPDAGASAHLFLPPLPPDLGLHVSLSRHARLGAGPRRDLPAHPFHPRRDAQRAPTSQPSMS